jgi:hypothetical protein
MLHCSQKRRFRSGNNWKEQKASKTYLVHPSPSKTVLFYTGYTQLTMFSLFTITFSKK